MSATITTTRKLTTLALANGHVLNLPARVPGIGITTEDALERALEFAPADALQAELKHHWEEGKISMPNASPEELQERVLFGFVSWLAMAGDWSE